MDTAEPERLAPDAAFLARVPRLTAFTQIVDPDRYAPLPDDWLIGVADIVNSTDAIARGQYKIVNMAGAAVIAGMSNALGLAPFPYAFGGDGASFAVPPAWADLARTTLARTAALVRDEFGLTLRTALVPMREVRQAGHAIGLARYAVSPDLDQTMFSGGGLAWAEEALKAGRFAIPPAGPGERPDLTGLSCRFEPIRSRRGIILSLIVRPRRQADAAFRDLVVDLLDRVERSPDMARPVPEGGPTFGWPPPGLDAEARLAAPAGPRWLRRVTILARSALARLVFRGGVRIGRFDPARYLRQLVANSDYRKYDDGLRMTIDCAPALADAIEARLGEAAGIAEYGLHRQDAALMTCITPSIHRDDHIHFVDGAAGGYAAAARAMKERATV